MRRKTLPEGWTLHASASGHDITATASNGRTPFFGLATCSACWIDDKTTWWVNRVLVAKDHRRQGLGSIVLQHVVDRIRAAGGRLVRVAPGGYDLPAAAQRAFYREFGFGDAADPDDEGVMELRL